MILMEPTGPVRPAGDLWETPPELYRLLDAELRFTVDAAASPTNALHPLHWTEEEDGLRQSWKYHRVFCNPPYSAPAAWCEKASRRRAEVAALLLPAATGSTYWRLWVWPAADEIRFLAGRVRFLREGRPAGTPRFESAVVIYRPGPRLSPPRVCCWDWRTP